MSVPVDDRAPTVPRLRVRTPRGVSWGVTLIAVAWVLLLIATAGLGFGIGAGSAKRYLFDVLLLAGPVLIFVGVVNISRSRRRLKALAQSSGERLCPQCHYDLSGLLASGDATHTCPECGLAVTREGVRRAWADYR